MSIYYVKLDGGIELETRIKRGKNLIFKCPYHKEKTPSFLYSFLVDEEGNYYCLGCGENGVVDMVGHLPETKEEIVQSFWEEPQEERKLFNTKEWILQSTRGGEKFWDVYLHPECAVIKKKIFDNGKNPFNS